MRYLRLILAVAFVAVTASYSAAQETDRDRAIKQYLQGNDIEAIVELEALVKQKQYASNAEVINYLGLAYQNALDAKKARKMFEKAVKLQPNNSVYLANLAYVYLLARQINKSQRQAKKALEIDPSNVSAYFVIGTADLWEGDLKEALLTAEKMVSINPGFPPGYMLKCDVIIATLGRRVAAGATVKGEIDLLRQSVEVLEAGTKNSPQNISRNSIEEKLEAIRVFYDYYNKDRTITPGVPPVPEPGVTPFKILSKPRAMYTDSARSSGVQGTVRLAVLLGANGRVVHILKLWGLGYGLDEQAIRAARQIGFQPKMKDGVPVSTVAIFEYSFNIY